MKAILFCCFLYMGIGSFSIGLTVCASVLLLLGVGLILWGWKRYASLAKKFRILSLAFQSEHLTVRIYDVTNNAVYPLLGKAMLKTGISLQEAMAMLHPQEQEEIQKAITRLIKLESRHEHLVHRWKRKGEDHYSYLEREVSVLKEHHGKATSLLSVHKDVTDRVMAERRVVEEMRKYSSLFYLSSVALEYYDKEGILVDINDKAIEQWDIHTPKEALLAQKISLYNNSLYQQKSAGKRKTEFFDCVCSYTGGRFFTQEGEMSPRTIQMHIHPVLDEQGELEGTILSTVDLTEIERINSEYEKLNKQLTETNQLMSVILDELPGSLFIKDAKDDYRYLIANKIFSEEVVCKEKSEIIGKTDFEIFEDQEMVKEFRADDKEVIEAEHSVEFIEEVTRGDGVVMVSKTKKTPLKLRSGKELLIGLSVDITEIYELNNRLAEAKEKAEQADKLKSAFLANMSHEIRTPLNAIVGFSELMQASETEAERREYMKVISTNSESLLVLINDILDLSKIEAGYVDMKMERFNLGAYFLDLETQYQRKMIPGVSLQTDFPDHTTSILFDKNRLNQIMCNLLNNAIKFTSEGFIKIGYQIETEGICFYCQDSGMGIAFENQARIFTNFVKLNDFIQGSGLGLSIVRSIVERAKGEIGVESQLGKGAKFWVKIPCEITKE